MGNPAGAIGVDAIVRHAPQRQLTTYLTDAEVAVAHQLMAATALDTEANLLRAALYSLARHVWGKAVDPNWFALQVPRSKRRPGRRRDQPSV